MKTLSPAGVDELIAELHETDDMVRLLSRWAHEAVRIRIKSLKKLTRLAPLDLLEVCETPIVRHEAVLVGRHSERPLAMISSDVMVGRLPEGVSRVFEIAPEQPLESLLRAYSPTHYERRSVGVRTLPQSGQEGMRIGMESSAILVAGSGLQETPRPLAHTVERIAYWLVEQKLGVQVDGS